MKIHHIVCISALSLLSWSCSDKVEPDVKPANTGDDVTFNVTLGTESRTEYGTEANDAFPIYWVNGDKVQIASPQCSSSANNALYEVEAGNNQNYATSLKKVGDKGVQWGTAETADFYSVYPGNNNITISGETASATFDISPSQVVGVEQSVTATDGMLDMECDMNNSILYAHTTASKTDKVVNLRYKPYSTVVEFTVNGLSTGSTQSSIQIQSVTLTAPEGTSIAGDFTLALGDTPSVGNVENGSNSISVSTIRYTTGSTTRGTYITLDKTNNKQLKFKMFLMPNGATINQNWSVTVATSAGTFRKNLAANTGELTPGMVHKISLPALEANTNWTFTPTSWMAQIPRNVYVSELTLPGAWYAYDGQKSNPEGYQTSNIQALFNAGVRAFQFETRVGFTGVFGGTASAADGVIVISGTGSNQTTGDAYYGATALTEALNSLASVFTSESSEFCVVAINYSDGGSKGLTPKYKEYFLNKLQLALSDSRYANRIATNITKDTTIGSVAGKIIVIINVDDAVEDDQATTMPNALLAYTDMSWDESVPNSSLVSTMSWAAMPTMSNLSSFSEINKDGLYMNYTLANRTYCQSSRSGIINPTYTFTSFEVPTGTTPEIATLQERKNSIETMINNSDVVYNNGTHNVWFYCGAGGTLASNKSGDSVENGPSILAGGSGNTTGLNQFLLDHINNKISANKPSPLGLVFINQCTNTSYSGPELIRAIFDMNNKFYLVRDENQPEWPSGTQPQDVEITSTSSEHASGYGVNTETWTVL